MPDHNNCSGRNVLKEMGYSNIKVVAEQEKPDGTFPYPNPEIREAMALGMEYAKRLNADLLLATDPDCDRVGAAVKDEKGVRGSAGEYVLLSGNEIGVLLFDYICSRRRADWILRSTGQEILIYFWHGRKLWLLDRGICT